jgi:hypothetical protein
MSKLALILAGLTFATVAAAQPGSTVVYRCPGPPVLYTDALSTKEAQERGCKAIEGAPVTVMPSTPRAKPAPVASTTPRPEARVDPGEQRTRDSESRRILEAELQREQSQLADLQKEYNNGEPERRGDERNYQRYLDRVAELKASISRKEADIAALKRELAKLPQ